jgi:hypothetical protein|tara:strand:- start:622 stop:921 length:300 start_codon:yes stop_codon:yes gene_type:complete
MTRFERGLQNVVAMHQQVEEEKSKEQHMADYIASIKALEEAMEPYKEQKRELKGNYIENGWLTKEDISLTVKAYRLLKTEVDLDQLIDIYESLRKKEGK